MEEFTITAGLALSLVTAIASASAMWAVTKRRGQQNTAAIEALAARVGTLAEALDERIEKLEHWRQRKLGEARAIARANTGKFPPADESGDGLEG